MLRDSSESPGKILKLQNPVPPSTLSPKEPAKQAWGASNLYSYICNDLHMIMMPVEIENHQILS